MASLLSKFRIDYSDLKVIPDITKKPMDHTVAYFESLISDFTVDTDECNNGGNFFIAISLSLFNFIF